MRLTCTAGAKCFTASEHLWGSEGQGAVSALFNRQEQERDYHSRQLLLLLLCLAALDWSLSCCPCRELPVLQVSLVSLTWVLCSEQGMWHAYP